MLDPNCHTQSQPPPPLPLFPPSLPIMLTLAFSSPSPPPPPPPSPLLCLNPPLTPSRYSFLLSKFKPLHSPPLIKRRKIETGICWADLSHDAPFAAAIGACMLSSLLLPNSASTEEDGDSAFDSTDARFAAMGIISFIPYFNWLVSNYWVFAWLDTGKRRYAAYSIAYLVPYLRSNLSLSPEESWLPIASIVLGVFHVQLEASIRNGDLQEFQLFKPKMKREDVNVKGQGRQGPSREAREDEHRDLPSAKEQIKE